MSSLRELQLTVRQKVEELRQRDALIDELEAELDDKDAIILRLQTELDKYRSIVHSHGFRNTHRADHVTFREPTKRLAISAEPAGAATADLLLASVRRVSKATG